jgi:uncharacterized protein YlxW (UPF0749 family)
MSSPTSEHSPALPDDSDQIPSSEQTGRDRLVSAMQPKASRAQVVVALLLAIVGFLAIVQVQTLNNDNAFAGARREDLITLLDTLEVASRRARAEIEQLEERRNALRSSSDRRTTAIEGNELKIEELSVLAGTVPTTGQGILVTIDDPAGAVTTSTVLNSLQEMRNAGAEAIELNDSVRIVADTEVVDTSEGLSVGGQEVQSPYVFEVIGPAETLETAMTFPGGLRDEVEELGGTVTVEQSENIEIDSLHTPEQPEYARPAN